MKLGILTQPLGHNYGGLLQAYALQRFLLGHGVEVVTFDRVDSRNRKFKNRLKNLLRLALGSIKQLPDGSADELVYSELRRFKSSFLSLSPPIYSTEELLNYIRNNSMDFLLVGSDQVWRPKYSPEMFDYFFEFSDALDRPPALGSYAASFGVDNWELGGLESRVSECLRRFQFVSVREASAVDLCREYLNIEADHVLDPTMLLEPSAYEELLDPNYGKSDYVLDYVLDANPSVVSITSDIINKLDLPSISAKPKGNHLKASKVDLESYIYPSVEQWVTSFYNSKFVVTDSFHGTVFSILFRKNFISITNNARGKARFSSLLSGLGLSERLFDAQDIDRSDMNRLVAEDVNWDEVNAKLESLKLDSINYIVENLKLS